MQTIIRRGRSLSLTCLVPAAGATRFAASLRTSSARYSANRSSSKIARERTERWLRFTSIISRRTATRSSWAPTRPPLHKARKGRVDVDSGAGGEELDLHTNGRRRGLHIFLKGFSSWIFRIDEYGKARGCRQQLVQEPEPLGYQLVAHGVDAGDVAARSAQAGDK